MKNPQQKNSKQQDFTKVIIVIGLFLIIAAIGYYFAMRGDMNPQESNNTPVTQTPTVVAGTQSYKFSNVTFSYPEEWKTEPHFRTRPNGKDLVDVTLIPPVKNNDNDVIVVGGYQLTCSNLDQSYTCKEMGGVPVYTKSKLPSLLKVLDEVVDSAKI